MSERIVDIAVVPCVPDPASIGQTKRCSVLDMSTETLPPGTTGLKWTVLDDQGAPLDGVTFNIRKDKLGWDTDIWTGLTSGSVTDVQTIDSVYPSEPQGTCAPFQVVVSAVVRQPDFPNQAWMTDHAAALRPMRLNDLPLPGIHDAGAFGINRSSPSQAGSSLPKAGELVGTAKAQGWGWSQMLLGGARYLDIRVTTYPGERGHLGGLFYTHTWIGERFDSGLRAWSGFLADHPGELIVLDFQHQPGFTAADHDTLAAQIQAALGPLLADVTTLGPTSLLSDFLDAGKRIVLLYEDTDDNSPDAAWFAANPWAWPRSATVRSIWGDKNNISALMTFLNGEIGNKPADKLWVLQCQQTAPLSTLLDLQKAAEQQTNPTVQSWLLNDVAADPINIAMVDWANSGGVPQAILERVPR